MKKITKLFLTLCLFLSLFGCKNSNQEELKSFSEYIDELVKNELSSDFLTYHYMLIDGNSYGVEKPEVTLGSLSLESTLESIEECKEELEVLYKYNKNKLNEEEKNIYRLLELQYKENIEYEKYLDFDFCFGDNKVNDNLITNFTEYRFDNEEDVKDFITLLNDTGRYIDEGIKRTQELADEGHIQNELIQDSIIKSCNKFINSNEIEKYFNLEINKLDISNKESYKQQVVDGVDIMQEAYGRIIDLYEEIGTSKYQGSLSEINGGKEYFEYLIQAYTGSNRSVKEWIKCLEDELEDSIYEWAMIIYFSDHDVYEEMDNIELPFDNAQDAVKYLENCIMNSNEFPSIDKVDYKVSYLDASIANDLTSAYYIIPPIDASNLNVIKVNPKNTDMVDLFSTLAHEGFPGHLYQNNYSIQNDLPIIYQFLDNLGAGEGWAEYIGHDAYRIGDIGSSEFQEFMRLMNYIDRILVEYIDLQVNYNGWNVEDIKSYLDEVGLSSEIASSLYDVVLQYPALYAPYSLGTYEIYRLRNLAMEELENDFSLIEFHKALLDTGLVHFEIIEKKIEEYMESK